jgi:uncharacterized protein (UPF0264 family)
VLLADLLPNLALIEPLAEAGFAAVMLDTAGKDGRSLLDHLAPSGLAAFVRRAHAAGLAAGLAGSLRLEHIPALLALDPDILGFRGALCRGASRTAPLDPARFARVRAALSSDSRRQRQALPQEPAP